MPKQGVERLAAFLGDDLDQLCGAAEEAIEAGGGFGWLVVPPRPQIEEHWRGVLASPFQELYVARLDGAIVGSGQLVKPIPKNQAGGHVAHLSTLFVAPRARGLGLGRALLEARERSARAQGFTVLRLDVRSTLTHAIRLHESCGFRRWGVMPRYARVEDRYVEGFFYWKQLD